MYIYTVCNRIRHKTNFGKCIQSDTVCKLSHLKKTKISIIMKLMVYHFYIFRAYYMNNSFLYINNLIYK